jgi:putative ABC transport system permease protein
MKRRHLEDLDRDIRDHIEEETQDNIARGMAPGEARRAALRKFGNILRVQEDTRDVWNVVWLEQLLQDGRYGLRALRRNPAFSAIVILTLALGIGVNTAVFSVVNAVMIRPLSYPNPDRLVAQIELASNSKAVKSGISGADFTEWRANAKSFDGMAGYFYSDGVLASVGDAGQVRLASVAGDFWAITGARAALGTLFAPDTAPGSIMLSHQLFERRFAGDSSIVGKSMILDGRPVTVTGVLTPDFEFLFPQNRPDFESGGIDAFVSSGPLLRSSRQRVSVAARLKPLVTMGSALTELQTVEGRILKTYPDRWFAGVERMRLVTLQERLVGNARRALLILQVAGMFVLLIACINVANLLLARASVRQREIAIRSAIGAGVVRVIRQFLTEGMVLALLGGATGLVLARFAVSMMASLGSETVPRLAETRIDPRVLGFTLAISVLSGVIFSLGPAISLYRTNLQNALKDRVGEPFLGWGGLQIRPTLVAFELALAIVLLTGAGLMIKSFWRMYTNPHGFSPEHTLLLKVSLASPEHADKPRQVSSLNELVRRIASVPGVEAAGIYKTDLLLVQSKDNTRPPIVDSFQENLVSPGYFGAIGMRLVKGRWITEADPPDATVINETMAKRAFGVANPIGQSIERLGRQIRVVGVAADLKYSKLDADPENEIFRAYPQNLGPGRVTMTLVIRVVGDPLGIAPAARKLISDIDPTQPIYSIETLQKALSRSITPRRFNLYLLGTFAAASLLMAMIGIYGVIAYSVAQRTREIGIRMALGAQRGAVVRMVVQQGMAIALSGIVAGVAAALGLTRFMASLLYGVRPNDTPTFAVVALLLAVTALLASWAPALKAAVVDPLIALRHE